MNSQGVLRDIAQVECVVFTILLTHWTHGFPVLYNVYSQTMLAAQALRGRLLCCRKVFSPGEMCPLVTTLLASTFSLSADGMFTGLIGTTPQISCPCCCCSLLMSPDIVQPSRTLPGQILASATLATLLRSK